MPSTNSRIHRRHPSARARGRWLSKHGLRLALWLGHEGVETTHGYVEADLMTTENAMGKLTSAPGCAPARFKFSDDLLAFLATL